MHALSSTTPRRHRRPCCLLIAVLVERGPRIDDKSAKRLGAILIHKEDSGHHPVFRGQYTIFQLFQSPRNVSADHLLPASFDRAFSKSRKRSDRVGRGAARGHSIVGLSRLLLSESRITIRQTFAHPQALSLFPTAQMGRA